MTWAVSIQCASHLMPVNYSNTRAEQKYCFWAKAIINKPTILKIDGKKSLWSCQGGWLCQVPALRLTLRAKWSPVGNVGSDLGWWAKSQEVMLNSSTLNVTELLRAVRLCRQKLLVFPWHCDTQQWGQRSPWLSVKLSAEDNMMHPGRFTICQYN